MEEQKVNPCFNRPMEERNADGLEALLDDPCPFVVALFSGSSPLSQGEGLAFTEQRLASAFPDLAYIKVDADLLGVRAFLQWDIAFLPMFVILSPGVGRGGQRQWVRWPDGGRMNPYDFDAAARFVSQATGLPVGNTTRIDFGSHSFFVRKSPGWSRSKLVGSWFLVFIVAFRKLKSKYESSPSVA